MMESGEGHRIRTWGTSLGGERDALAREAERQERGGGDSPERGFVEGAIYAARCLVSEWRVSLCERICVWVARENKGGCALGRRKGRLWARRAIRRRSGSGRAPLFIYVLLCQRAPTMRAAAPGSPNQLPISGALTSALSGRSPEIPPRADRAHRQRYASTPAPGLVLLHAAFSRRPSTRLLQVNSSRQPHTLSFPPSPRALSYSRLSPI